MAHYSKGIQTRKRIISTARKLFFEKSYQNVTIREIAAKSDVNLGLINYYFNGKADIGMIVYSDIRNGFNDLISQYIPDQEGVYYFLLGSAIELLLSVKNNKYANFYMQMSAKDQFKEEINSIIVKTLLKYSVQKDTANSAILSSLSIMSTKPAIIEYSLKNPDQLNRNVYLRYYLEAQLYQFGMDKSMADNILSIMDKYHIDVGESFTPVMVKKPE